MKGRKDALVLICTGQPRVLAEISAQLMEMDIAPLTVEDYVFTKRMDDICRCAEILEDDGSAEIYTEIIESRLMGRWPSGEIINQNQYFTIPEFLISSENEVLVDCGAFVGDTIEKYVALRGGTAYERIIAFEPSKINYRAMQIRMERLQREWNIPDDKIQLVNAGVGSKTTDALLVKDAASSSRVSERENLSGDSIKIYALDDFFQSQKVSFIKADIENYELDMLQGAEKVIRRDKPKLAICIYHNISHLYSILLWLADLNLDYKFSVRHHYPLYAETVLYAYH